MSDDDSVYCCSRCQQTFTLKKNCKRHIERTRLCSRASVSLKRSADVAFAADDRNDEHNSFTFDPSQTFTSSSSSSSSTTIEQSMALFANQSSDTASDPADDDDDNDDDERTHDVDVDDLMSQFTSLSVLVEDGTFDNNNDSSSSDDDDRDATPADNGQFANVNVSVATALVQLAFEKPVRCFYFFTCAV